MVPKNNKKRLNPDRVYRKIVVFFVIITVFLTVIIVHFALTKAKIIVTPAEKVVNSDFIVELRNDGLAVAPSDWTSDYLPGQIFAKEVTGNGIYDSSGTKLVESDSLGMVTIYNNNSASQTLVATTQLQTKEGYIVRIKDKVIVPAKGEVAVGVYAPDSAQIIGGKIPAGSKLTIIKLGANLQSLIYGMNSRDLVVGGAKVKVVSEEDIERAKNNLVDKLVGEAILGFKKEITVVNDSLTEVIDKKIISFTSKQKSGEESEVVEGTLTLNIVAAVFDKNQLLRLAEKKLRANLSSDEELFRTNSDSLYFAINNYDAVKNIIFLNVSLTGVSSLSTDSDLLAVGKFGGMTAEEVNDYLGAFDSIKAVQVELFPFWVKRVPKLEERIEVTFSP